MADNQPDLIGGCVWADTGGSSLCCDPAIAHVLVKMSARTVNTTSSWHERIRVAEWLARHFGHLLVKLLSSNNYMLFLLARGGPCQHGFMSGSKQ